MKKVELRQIVSILVVVVVAISVFVPFSESSKIGGETTGTPAGWTDDIRLTNNTLVDYKVAQSADGDDVHLAWATFRNTKWRVYYLNSKDSGKTWSNEVELGVPMTNPDIAASNGHVHLVYDSFEIYYCNSTDGGTTWNPEKMISSNDGFNSEGAKIAVSEDGQSIHLVWVDSRNGSESFPLNTELYYTRSLNGGVNWEAEKRLTNALYGSASQEIIAVGNTIHVVWGDGRYGITTGDVFYKRSLDNGVTWEDGLGNINQDRRITNNATNHGTPHFAVSGSNIYIVWFDQVGSDYYIYYRKSSDNGVSWEPIQLLVGPFPGTSYRPRLAVENNTVHMVWMDMRDDGSTREIYYKNSTDGGANWNSDLRLTYSNGSNSWWPEIAVGGNKTHVAWYDERDGNSEVYYKRYPDFPPDTDPPSHSNEIPFPDSYKDAPGTNISVHVTDPSGVNESTIQLYVNESLVSASLTPITDGYNVSYISLGFSPGIVTCRIVAEDNCGNHLDYTWNFTVLATYVIPLQEGWNLISVPFVQVDTSINEVLKDIDGKWDYIQVYNATDPDHWKTNLTYRPAQLNDLKLLNHKMGFWINVTEPNVNLMIRGNISAYTIIPLYAGWNLVGYPTQTIESVGNALWGTGADGVEVFDPSDPYRLKEVGSTYIMKPGEGYWVHVVADSIWTINW